MSPPDPSTLAVQLQGKRLPPLERWNPPLSGDIDIRIARGGSWWHEGAPIRRESLVRLFSTILRREDDGCYYLLTPVEKWRIQVDDVPFLAVFLEVHGEGETRSLVFRTNVGDFTTAGTEHVLRVVYNAAGEPSPYVHVRAGLWALISRSVFLELAELATVREIDGQQVYGVHSQGVFFSLGPVAPAG